MKTHLEHKITARHPASHLWIVKRVTRCDTDGTVYNRVRFYVWHLLHYALLYTLTRCLSFHPCSNVFFCLFFFSLKVVSSVSSRLHLNRLSRPDLSSTDVRPNWRRRVASATSSCSRPVDWASLAERFRRGLSRLKGGVPALKMPPVRGRRGWCGCFQVNTHKINCTTPAKQSTNLRKEKAINGLWFMSLNSFSRGKLRCGFFFASFLKFA